MRRRALSAGGRPRGHRAKPSRGLPATDGAPARLLPPAQPARHRARRGSDRGHPGRGPGGRGGRTVIVLKSAREIALMRRAGHILAGTRESLDRAIQECRPERRLSDVSHAVQSHVEAHGFSIVRAFVGHGIGRALHEEPQIPNFGDPGRGPQLRAGMVLAIEPMVTMGSWEVRILDDGWTAVTQDGSLAAHFEHTVAVTENGPEVLTRLAGAPAESPTGASRGR